MNAPLVLWVNQVCGVPHGYHEAMRTIDAHRPDTGEFYHDTVYDDLPLSLLMERDADGFHLREIWSMKGTEINWIPRHIAGLIKAQAVAELEKEES